MSFFIKFKNFVDKNKLWFLIGYMILSVIVIFVPYGKIEGLINISFFEISKIINLNIKRYNDINDPYYYEYVHLYKKWIIYYSFLGASLIVAIIVPIIFYSIKRKLITVWLFPLIFTIASLQGTPHIAFYLLLLLTLFELLYYTSWIISKRPIKEKPIKAKESKLKKLSDKERIALLEKEAESLKEKTG